MYDFYNIIDEIQIFLNKLSKLIEDDWIKTKHFIKIYKTDIVLLIILIILIDSLDYNTYNNVQTGGVNFEQNYTLQKSVKNQISNYENKTQAITNNIERESAISQVNRIKPISNNVIPQLPIEGNKSPSISNSPIDATQPVNPVKVISTKTVLQPNIIKPKTVAKPKANKTRSKLGPVFGNLGMITDYFTKITKVLSIILVCFGVLSLPVFIFLILVYMILKYIIKNILIL